MSKPNSISYGVRSEDDGSDMEVSSDDDGLQNQAPAAVWDGASDSESTGSFRTAPNSPIDLTLDDEQDMGTNRPAPPDIMSELVNDQDKLNQELKYIIDEEKRIASLLEEKKAQLEAIRVRQLEHQVRKSIQKNRKAVITPAKSKKGKEKAPIDAAYRSCNSSSEEDGKQPPRKAKAIMNIESGRPERQPVKEPARAEPHIDTVKRKETQADPSKDGAKATDDQRAQSNALIIELERSLSAKTPSSKPNLANIVKLNKHILREIRESQHKGNTTVGQMKMFLCDLYDRFLEEGELSRIQKVHYKELVKQVSKYDKFGDNHIPSKVKPKNARKQKQPEKRCMLPNEFYGHPGNLNFRNPAVDRNKLMDALSCSEIEEPRVLLQAKNLLSRSVHRLKLSDFEGVIGSDGQVVDKEELMLHMGPKKIRRLATLHKQVADRPYYQDAPAAPTTMGQRTRHEYYLAQRRLEESVMRETGTNTPEPSTVGNPPVSDSSAMVSLAPSSEASDANPITTITYIPHETSFIRSVMPGGREPKQLTDTQKTRADQHFKLPTNPNTSNESNANAVILAKAPTKPPTRASALNQTPTIPRALPSSQLSASSSLSASTTPSSSSKITHPNQPQPSTSQAPPPQQNKSSTFQPYRSALDSLGVTRSVDVRSMKTGILCRAESNGGVCNDTSCRDMHFTDFTHT
ncbi:hypothetical protein MBANPS3_002027 [Mucor bainieri]